MSRDPSENELDERTRQELARLADGSLTGEERILLEARVDSSPTLREALERQRAGVSALRGLAVNAPPGLRSEVEGLRRTRRRQSRRRVGFGAALAGAAAAAALVVGLVLSAGGGEPTVIEAAALADRPATTGSVPVDPANTHLLAAEVEGVPFPNLHRGFAWREMGERTDELDGRRAVTVFYERPGARIGYTILAGNRIDPPEGARRSLENGVALHTSSAEGRPVVTWYREGRTCVVSGRGVTAGDLREVASWKGDGAVPF